MGIKDKVSTLSALWKGEARIKYVNTLYGRLLSAGGRISELVYLKCALSELRHHASIFLTRSFKEVEEVFDFYLPDHMSVTRP